MAHVLLTSHLRRFFPSLPGEVEVGGASVSDVVAGLDRLWPGLGFYVADEQGRLRTNVAVFVDGERVRAADAKVAPTSTVQVVQALSGG
jgi:hypothetical protein